MYKYARFHKTDFFSAYELFMNELKTARARGSEGEDFFLLKKCRQNLNS